MAAALLTLTADAALTAAFARALAPELGAGDTLLLDGPVGAGKSHFARALIRAHLANPAEDVPSPTFTLVQFYEGEPAVAHFDLYRLTRPDEAFEIGLDEALDEGCAIIEWPERLGDDPVAWLGVEPLKITLAEHDGGRRATVSGAGDWEQRLKDLHV